MNRRFNQIIFSLLLFSISQGQIIGIKTIPVAEMAGISHIYSFTHGMGGVTIAVDDWALDPITHPAKGRFTKGFYAIGSPVFSSVSEDIGSTKILPLTLLYGDSLWFGNAAIAYQAGQGRKESMFGINSFQPVTRDNQDNYQFSISFGKKFPDQRFAIGTALCWANMHFLPGVNLLYGQNDYIKQSGNIYDVRVGANGWFEGGQTWDVTAVYSRIDMEHKIINWLPWFSEPSSFAPTWTQVEEDVTDTYGISLEYVRPFSSNSWQAGFLITFNYKNHPKIPNYTLMNIPRDPGNSVAGNIGIGISKKSEAGILGIDLVYEPIRSRTWADAAEEITTWTGSKIYPGQKTVYNYFDISNWILRMGFSEKQPPIGIQLGLSAHRISYWLDQKDYITQVSRSQYENWIELTGSWGFLLRLTGFDIHYSGSITIGTGIPGAQGPIRTFAASMDYAKGNFVVAPSGSLLVEEHEIFIHQIALIVPLF